MTIQESIDRAGYAREHVGRLEGYSNVSGAIVQLMHAEMARGMPNGPGYAQALADLVSRLGDLVVRDRP